jgi:pimeloyl-ACP methyl ester carboxylesterase
MKTLKRLLFIITGICLLMACSKDNGFLGGGQDDLKYVAEKSRNINQGLDQDRWVTIKVLSNDMQYINLRVHYRIIGKGPIDMVFLPEYSGPLTIWTKQFDYFRDKARCIYIDKPGCGLSDAPEGIKFTPGLNADATYEILKKEGVKKFIAVGFYQGSVDFGQFHLKHPGMMTKLVNLNEGFTVWPPEGTQEWTDLYATLEGWYLYTQNETREEKIAQVDFLVPPATSPADLREWATYFYDYPSWLMADQAWWSVQPEVNKPIDWNIPILCIYSFGPPELPIDWVNSFFCNPIVEIYTGPGVILMWEQHEIVNPRIWEFVSDRPGRRY